MIGWPGFVGLSLKTDGLVLFGKVKTQALLLTLYNYSFFQGLMMYDSSAFWQAWQTLSSALLTIFLVRGELLAGL